jgi:hypothetical protein
MLNPLNSGSKISKLLAFSVIKKKNMLKKIPRLPLLFITFYLLYKGLLIAFVMQHFLKTISLFTIGILCITLYSFIEMFEELLQVMKVMKFLGLANAIIRYFFTNFVDGKNWKKPHKFKEYTERTKELEMMHLRHYYQQFILKMEAKIFKISKKFWSITFFPLVVFSLGLWTFTFFFGARLGNN